jgi:DNA topoisomerase-3
VPEPYWVLTTKYRNVIFASTKGKFTSKEEGFAFLEKVKNALFTVTDVSKKNGTEAPPRLFDLTSLQVECNKKFGYSADQTLQLIQSLYEKKFTTYPRVDTTFLSDDIYPKCPQILSGLRDYQQFIAPLGGKKLLKSKKVFDSSKVTDHHAIIPTGVPPTNLSDMEKHVYDMIARRFIAVFYPDCKFATTTVMGEVDKIEFKATGKQILEPGWRVLFEKQQTNLPDEEANKEKDEERVLPAFVKGESGEHIPDLAEKMTTPPKFYTEATLLRAMETAGKLVDSDELRDALKENGIGRPSTRAAIIETLFKRKYIRKEKKNLVATPTGMELIGLIREELLKSAELTGIWEKKLREIEKKSYDAATFVGELKQMVTDIVNQVLADNTNRRISLEVEEEKPAPKKRAPRKSSKKKDGDEGDEAAVASGGSDSPKPKPASPSLVPSDELIDTVCPVCGQGRIIKGRAAYGCSNWKSGCKFVLPFNTEVK